MFDDFKSIVCGLSVEVASNQTNVTRCAGQLDELGCVEGLYNSVSQVLVIFSVVFSMQLKNKI